MKRRQDKIQYTVRNIPEHLDKAIRKAAQGKQLSLNQFLVLMLNEGLKLFTDTPDENPNITFNDLDKLAGSWVEDPEFDKSIQEQSCVDDELWK